MRDNAKCRPVVVVVDDEEGDRNVIEAILSDEYDVVLCTNGQEAIRALDRYPTAIVLCDQRMPGLTGDEVVTRIRVLYPDTVRILITAYTDAAILIRALNEGGIFAHVAKPFDPETLRGIVGRARKFQEIAVENRRLLVEMRRLKLQVDEIVRGGGMVVGGDTEALERAASDELTAVSDPRFLKRKLHEEQQRILRYGNPASILLVDVDDFGRIAATYGREVAQRILKQVGGVLRRWSRAVDVVARFSDQSGDEPSGFLGEPPDRFLILSPNTLEPGALILGERLRRSVAEMLMEPDVSGVLKVTVSIGAATCEGQDGPLLDEVIRRSEQALSWAKKLGKNRVVTWTELKEILISKPQSRFVARREGDT